MASIKVTTAKSLETALQKFKNPERYPDYEIRHDFHQSQSSLTICFYAKCVKPDSFKINLTSANTMIYITCGIDNGFRKVMMKLKLPTTAKSVSKCTLAATKIEIVVQKEEQTSWATCGELDTNIIELKRTKKKAGDDLDALNEEEYEEMPRLEAYSARAQFFESVEYVDSDDSSLAGIDDLEWVETGEGNDASKKIVPAKDGGLVDDEVYDRMYEMKRKLM